jgi:hypothetical protein
VNRPGEHLSQIVDPVDEYEPILHKPQPDAFKKELNLPAAHKLQELKDRTFENCPLGQTKH